MIHSLSLKVFPFLIFIVYIIMFAFPCVCAQSLSCVQLFETSWTVACQASQSMGFSRQEYWGELPLPSHIYRDNLYIQFSLVTQMCLTLRSQQTAACQAFLSIINSWSLLKLMFITQVIPSNQLCHSLLFPPSIFPKIRVFSNESVLCIRWPKYQSFSFSISSSNKYSGLISFRMDRLDLLAVQGTLKSLRQHHSSKASILQCPTFFTVQLSHPYMTTGKSIALTRRTFASNVSAF